MPCRAFQLPVAARGLPLSVGSSHDLLLLPINRTARGVAGVCGSIRLDDVSCYDVQHLVFDVLRLGARVSGLCVRLPVGVLPGDALHYTEVKLVEWGDVKAVQFRGALDGFPDVTAASTGAGASTSRSPPGPAWTTRASGSPI